MTKAAAFYSFFSSFGLEAYEENAVYSEKESPAFPYLTYEMQSNTFDGNDIYISASLWYRTGASWRDANAKVEEISEAIGRSGKTIKIDGGYLLIMRGSPFSQNLSDVTDSAIKRKLLNFVVRFYTNN